jgi:hypothetical protein
VNASCFAVEALPSAVRGMTATGLAILAKRSQRCPTCARRGANLCVHPSAREVAAAADALDALVNRGRAQRVEGERLGGGGTSSTIWYPS